MRQTKLWLLATAAALAALACGPAGSSAPAAAPAAATGGPKYGGTVLHRQTVDPWDWDISYNKASPNGKGTILANDSLLTFKYGPDVGFDDLVVQPKLAERWDVSPDA